MMGRNANSFRITRESASANIMQMLVGEGSEDDVQMANQDGKSRMMKIAERPTQMVCGGIEKV